MACCALPAPLASRDLQAAFALQSDLRAAEGGDMTTRGRPFRSLTKRPKDATSPRYGRKAAGRASSELQAIVTLFTLNLSPAQAFGSRAIPIARNRRNAEGTSQMTASALGKRRSR